MSYPYSISSVTHNESIGSPVGANGETSSNSLLDIETDGQSTSGGSRNSSHGKIGDNGLPQRDAPVVAGHLPVGKDLETAAFQ